MNKSFTKEPEGDQEKDGEDSVLLPPGQKNYMTPEGFAAMQSELRFLMREERPKIVEVVSWAAGNGDRSENGDYIYGKKRLREIDRRVRYLTKRIESAEVVDPSNQMNLKQIFFGATVEYVQEDNARRTVRLVGVDEADLSLGKISWLSPVAKALMKAQVGDVVELNTPSGPMSIEVITIRYGEVPASQAKPLQTVRIAKKKPKARK